MSWVSDAVCLKVGHTWKLVSLENDLTSGMSEITGEFFCEKCGDTVQTKSDAYKQFDCNHLLEDVTAVTGAPPVRQFCRKCGLMVFQGPVGPEQIDSAVQGLLTLRDELN